jgi:hypothetical protein
MADEQDVNTGSETSGDQTETSQEETTDTAAETTEKPEETAQDAGGAAEQNEADGSESAETAAPDANESRTGVAEKGLHAGDPCKCPDGRKGTVHSFDAGLICIPNSDQG